MKKSFSFKCLLGLIILLFLIPFTLGSADAQSRTEQKIYDDAGLLTQDEITDLEELAEKYGEEHQTDFIIITSPNKEGRDVEELMAEAYDENGFGYDKEFGNTVMLMVDMEYRDFYIASFYDAKTYLASERTDKVRNKIIPQLSNNDFYGAFVTFMKTSNRYMNFKPGVNPDNIFYNTFFQAAVALALAGFIVFAMAYNSRTKITTRPDTYRDDQTTKVLRHQDIYLRKTVKKTAKPKVNSGGGGGGRGGGGGGTTGGGHSYGGSRGSF